MSGRESQSCGLQQLIHLQVPFLTGAPRQDLIHQLHWERVTGPIAAAQHGDYPRCSLAVAAPFGAGDDQFVRWHAAIRQKSNYSAAGRPCHPGW